MRTLGALWDFTKSAGCLIQAAAEDVCALGAATAGAYLGNKKIAPTIVTVGAALLGTCANNFNQNIQKIARIAGGVLSAQVVNYALDKVGKLAVQSLNHVLLTHYALEYEPEHPWVTPFTFGLKAANMYEALQYVNGVGSAGRANNARLAQIVSLIAGGTFALAGMASETIGEGTGFGLGAICTFALSKAMTS